MLSKNNCKVMLNEETVKIYTKLLNAAGCTKFISAMVEEDTGEFTAQKILSEEAATALCENLKSRLVALYRQVLFRSLRYAVKEFDAQEFLLPSGKPLDALQKAVQKVFSELIQNDATPLKIKYPLLVEYEKVLRKNFKAAFKEFFERFFLYKDKISVELFEGKPVTKIINFSTSGADTHRHGRTVMRVETDAGNFYYKPHDCSADVAYYKIVTNWFSDCTVAAKIVPGAGFAFVQELKFSEVEKASDIKKFFYNFGGLTALFHGLGTCDMHNENILACGVRPAAVDLETLIAAPSMTLQNENLNPLMQKMFYLVRSIGILPFRIHLAGMTSPLYADSVDSENINHLPHFHGKFYTVEGYEEDFICGFYDVYEKVLTHRTEILNFITENSSAVLRVIPKNTSFYAHILSTMFRAEYLSGVESREKVLEHLQKNAGDFAAAGVEYEKKCLLEGEIPYFCVNVKSRALCGASSAEVLQENYFGGTALDALKGFLENLSLAERNFEVTYIRRCFKHAPVDETVSTKKYSLTSSEIKISDAQKIAAEIFTETLDEKISVDGNIFWHCYILEHRLKPSLSFLTSQAAVAFYCNKILKCTALKNLHSKAKILLAECLTGMVAQISFFENEPEKEITAVGLYDGFGGLILALNELGETELLKRVFDILNESKIVSETLINLADGSAGLILAASEVKNFKVENLIRRHAENILAKEFPEDVSASKGLAGIGAAFSAAYKVTGNEKFLAASKNCFEKICAKFSKNKNGWLKSENVLAWLAERTPNAPGIGICAQKASEFSDAEIFSEVEQLALNSLLGEKNIFLNDSLNEGNAAAVLFLNLAAKKFNRAEYLQRARQILFAMNERRSEIGNFKITEKGVRTFFEASMFVGTLGAGCVALLID